VSPFKKFVSESARVFQSGKKISPPRFKKSARKIPRNAPCALIFSPHPDDECIVGALPFRLRREAKWKIVNVAVTLGSKRERRTARLRELKNACDFLGFDLIVGDLETRKKNRTKWEIAVKAIVKIFIEQEPRVIFLPHENDVHPTHIGTHFLVLHALQSLPEKFQCFVVETEFWGQMAEPNLLVESSVEDVANLVAALSLHVGEIKRNPYHARLPAWMMDNVRRGAELVGGKGCVAPDFTFGTIYRLQEWRGGKLQKVFSGEKFLSQSKNTAGLFR
jgi:LmbE family N-acetylglucosaminyl deacetylase